MKKRLTRADVHAQIAQLEQKTELLEADLKHKIAYKIKYYKPGNILKRLMERITSAPIQQKALFSAIFTAGLALIGKKMFSFAPKLAKKSAGILFRFGYRSVSNWLRNFLTRTK